jgi:hypothetical protein
MGSGVFVLSQKLLLGHGQGY